MIFYIFLLKKSNLLSNLKTWGLIIQKCKQRLINANLVSIESYHILFFFFTLNI